jgi:hypothetical protein
MKCKNLILGLLSILLLSYNAEAADAKFKVQFVVPPWFELADQVKSYGTRELRAIHDVELVDVNPNLSAYFISIYPQDIEHAVLTGSPDQLKSLVEKIIAVFDTKWLEQKRHK